MESEFARLSQAVSLCLQGRTHAAKSIWQGLSNDFRVRVMKYAVDLFGPDCDLSLYKLPVTIESPYGLFEISTESLQNLKKTIPILVA